jgi:hypothetical protein
MDRVSFVQEFATLPKRPASEELVHAFVRCLTPEEAAELLLRSTYTHSAVRSAAIKKVGSDIASSQLSNPISVVSDLMERIRTGESKKRNSVAYSLLNVARACPQTLKVQVQEFLSDSCYVGLRRRGYKLFMAESPESCQLLEVAWRKYNDIEATLLIIKAFPPDFLVTERIALLQNLTEGWQLSRLYLRITEVNPELLQELLALDPISFMYIAAKRGVVPPIDTVNQVLETSFSDQRLGLLLWSIGELRMWDVLSNFANRLGEVESAWINSMQIRSIS